MSAVRTTFIVALTLLSTLTAFAAEPGKTNRYALLVGVRQYPDAKELRELVYAERDVTELGRVLREGGYKTENVVVMTQSGAADDLHLLPMRRRILNELRTLLADRKPDDTVLVAFAGHGIHFTGDANSYFCPSDAQLNDRTTLLSLPEVYAELEKCKAGMKLLLVDACRNDPFVQSTRAAKMELESVTRPALPPPPGGVIALFACSENEKAYEDDQLKHGVFFQSVIKGLSGYAAGDSGEVSPLALSAYVTSDVQDFVQTKHKTSQTPELVGRTRGASSILVVNEARLHCVRGEKCENQRDLDQALKEYSDAIRINPDLAVAYAGRGETYNRKGDSHRAIKELSKAIELDPNYTCSFVQRGLAYDHLGEPDAAIADLNEVLRLSTFSCSNCQPLAYALRGGAYSQKKKWNQAIADYSECLKIDPKWYWALVERGQALNALDKYNEAIADFSGAIKLYLDKPEDYEVAIGAAYKGRGDVDFNLHKYEEAVADYTQAIRLAPVAERPYSDRGDAYRKLGEEAKAKADYREADRLKK